ncbi:hypothetical protein ACFFX0_20990 [Citricoccus parietis]|uniref:Uncharacterized protein n=1 Tax=Citricoccus parietis TaxID=592307 RepID=A0ABV5G3M8_9MICC
MNPWHRGSDRAGRCRRRIPGRKGSRRNPAHVRRSASGSTGYTCRRRRHPPRPGPAR